MGLSISLSCARANAGEGHRANQNERAQMGPRAFSQARRAPELGFGAKEPKSQKNGWAAQNSGRPSQKERRKRGDKV